MTPTITPPERGGADPVRERLPGVYCDPSLPRAADEAILLDVAAFVGLAERGPVDIPVLVEDPAQYATVFGGDLALAVDNYGVPIYAALPDAVRSFFDNGGQRAYVVRVVGDGALTLAIPLRVSSRIPLGGGVAVTDVALGQRPVTSVQAASPGGWATGVTVDVDVVDTVLALATVADPGTPGSRRIDLTPASKGLLDEGDAVLVRRASGSWKLLWVPAAPASLAPAGGWQEGDVGRLLRADLTVRVADGDVAQAVERFTGLRLGPGTGRSPTWTDVLQPSGSGFHRDRSMYLRGPGTATLVPVLGPVGKPVAPVPASDIPPACSRAALEADGLVSFDPVPLFVDPALHGHTVEGLRLALEALGLDDEPRARGLHAVALVPEVSILALPDLYHRPWTEQAVLSEGPAPEPPLPPIAQPIGFHTCEVAPDAPVTVPPLPRPPAVLRMVVDPPSEYDPTGLHEVAGAVVDLCAARADLVAVLGLPRHAGLAEARDLADVLAARRAATIDVPSYAGIWHPWGAVAKGDVAGGQRSEQRSPSPARLRPVPPDGAVVGTIAATERSRGWWIEPAGRPLAGFVDADVLDQRTTVELFAWGLNVIRRRSAGLAATGAHTVSADPSLLQLSVRRLLIYVRKLALREGNRFVFEPDDEYFRTQVATTFGRFLEVLRVEGALAAYQVEVESLRTRTLADEGKLRIDLKLAPTSPIEFVTVSLLRSGDGLIQVLGA